MLTPSTRPRGDNNLTSRLGRTDESVSLLSRRIAAQKRIRPSAAATAMAVTRAVGTYSYSGGGSLLYNGWVFTENPYGGDAEAPGVTDAGNAVAVTDEGWYSFRWKQTIQFPATGSFPTSMQAELNSDRLSGIPDPFWTVVLVENHFGLLSGRSAAVIDYTTAPLWVEAGETFMPKLFWVGAGDPTTYTNYGIHLFVNRLA